MRRNTRWPPVPFVPYVICGKCGKHAYHTERRARLAARHTKIGSQRPYPAHGWWHLTSQQRLTAAKPPGRTSRRGSRYTGPARTRNAA